MARTKNTPRKLAPGHAGINVILAPVAQQAMYLGSAALVAQQGVGVARVVAGAAPRRMNKKKSCHIYTEVDHSDEEGKFLDWKDCPASLDELRAMAGQLRREIKRKMLRGEYYTDSDEE